MLESRCPQTMHQPEGIGDGLDAANLRPRNGEVGSAQCGQFLAAGEFSPESGRQRTPKPVDTMEEPLNVPHFR